MNSFDFADRRDELVPCPKLLRNKNCKDRFGSEFRFKWHTVLDGFAIHEMDENCRDDSVTTVVLIEIHCLVMGCPHTFKSSCYRHFYDVLQAVPL